MLELPFPLEPMPAVMARFAHEILKTSLTYELQETLGPGNASRTVWVGVRVHFMYFFGNEMV